jgi:hypothetical protein
MNNKQLTQIDNSIFEYLVELESLTPNQIDRFITINNNLYNLNIQRKKIELAEQKKINSLINSIFVSRNSNNYSPPSNNQPFKKNSLNGRIFDCLKSNGPQTSFQLAQNIGHPKSKISHSLNTMNNKKLVKIINKEQTKKNGSGSLKIYDVLENAA